MLGVKPAIGRLIGPGDSAVAVVSWSYWKSRFNLDPAILGRRIVVEDAPVTIVGVTAREFFGLQVGLRPDIWVPLRREPARPGSSAVDRAVAVRRIDRASACGNGGAVPVDARRKNQGQQ